jgi:uracil-DNA glycosylase family 4
MAHSSLASLEGTVVRCRACPRLVAWREQVAHDKRAAYADETYWGRPVPGFGDPEADIVVVGLAPAAHGANRTGRMFTGDRSGDWLFAAMHRAGLANQPTATHRDDGLVLTNAWVTSPVKCAPPANRPTAEERDRCGPFLADEIRLLDPRVYLALGGFGWDAVCRHVGWEGRKPRFGHGAEAVLADGRTVLGSYHVSQQNTFTGRLTADMLDDVFARAIALAG